MNWTTELSDDLERAIDNCEILLKGLGLDSNTSLSPHNVSDLLATQAKTASETASPNSPTGTA